jgi:hypothetical protein
MVEWLNTYRWAVILAITVVLTLLNYRGSSNRLSSSRGLGYADFLFDCRTGCCRKRGYGNLLLRPIPVCHLCRGGDV